MKDEKDLGADAAAVVTAGREASDAATARHTHGPWRIDHRGEDRYLLSAEGDSLMCDMRYYPWCPEEEADWHLIAAAPELLDAARRAQWFLRQRRSDDINEQAIAVSLDIAIRKAEGRTP